MRLKVLCVAASFFCFVLCTLHFSAPAQVVYPKAIASVDDKENGALLTHASSIATSGNFAYVTSYETESLEVVDITDPAAPSHKGRISLVTDVGVPFKPVAVYTYSHYAYVIAGDGGAVRIIDVASPTNPQLVASYESPIVTQPRAMFFGNGIAYLSGAHSIEILDMADPTLPKVKGHLTWVPGVINLKNASDLVVTGDFAYVVADTDIFEDFSSVIEILNISNPQAPSHVTTLRTGDGQFFSASPRRLIVSGSVLYVAADDAIHVVDVTHPNAPVLNTTIHRGEGGTTFHLPSSIAISGKLLAVGAQNAIEFMDLSDPHSPVHLSKLVNIMNGVELEDETFSLNGDKLYIANWGFNRVDIYTMVNPLSPQRVGSIEDGDGGAFLSRPTAVHKAGNFVYAVTIDERLEILDVSHPEKPLHRGALKGIGKASALAFSDGFLFVPSLSENKIRVIDVSDPSTPVVISTMSNGQDGAALAGPNALTLSNKFLYVASRSSKALEIIDVSDPSRPVHAGKIVDGDGGAFLNEAVKVSVADNFAYVIGDDALEIVDVSDPHHPLHTATVHHGDNGAVLRLPTGVANLGSFVYVSSYFGNALEIIDVSNPAAPIHHSTILSGDMGINLNNPLDVRIFGKYAFVMSDSFIDVLDCSAPSAPFHVSGVRGYTSYIPGDLLSYDYADEILYAGSAPFDGAGASFIVLAIFSPQTPTALTISRIAQTSFTATWKRSGNTTNYLVDLSDNNFSTNIRRSVISDTVAVLAALPGTHYKVKVYAANARDTTTATISEDVLTLPATPSLLPTTMITPTSFTARWTPSQSATEYYLNVATDPSFGTSSLPEYNHLNVGNVITFLVRGLEPHHTYYYQLSAGSVAGTSPFSEPAMVSVITGLETQSENISLYPNPASESFRVKIDDVVDELELDIFDQLGRKIMHQEGGRDYTVDCRTFYAC